MVSESAIPSELVATHDGRPVVYEFVRKPPVDEASAVSDVPVGDPMRSEPSATAERPVPPRVLARVPVQVGARVKVPPELVMFKSMLVSEEVASVSAPVCADPNECWSEATPLLIEDVATQVGTPETSARTWPFVPCEVVATAPEPFPKRSVFAWSDAQPVPPFAVGRMPETSAARLMSDVETTPAVALRKPESAPIESVFETLRLDVLAYVATFKNVEVAFVDVLFTDERNAIDDEAFTDTPSVVVGVSAPATMLQSLTRSSDEDERRLLNADQSEAKRQPKVPALAVAHVTFPAEYASAPEKVVVAAPTHCPSTRVRTWPFVAAKSDEVETAVGTADAPVLFASSVFAAMAVSESVAFEPPTSAPAPPEMVMPLFAESVVVPTDTSPAVPLP
jgi:hypothetical protein